MHCNVLIRNGIAYIPTPAETDVGYYLDIEPVEVADVLNVEALDKAIRQTIARGHPPAASLPTIGKRPQWVVLKYAKVKSIKAFENNLSRWQLAEDDDVYQIEPFQKSPHHRGWVPDHSRQEILPLGTSLDEAIKRFVVVIQTAQKAEES